MRQTLHTVNRKHLFMNIFCIYSFRSQTHSWTLLFRNKLLKYGRHFDYWNQSLNMHITVRDIDLCIRINLLELFVVIFPTPYLLRKQFGRPHFFLWRYSPNFGLGLPPWNSPFHFDFLDFRQSVGLLGRVISSSQGLYLYTNRKTHTRTHTKHPCPEWDSNPRSRLPCERRQYMP
jgi:hypothetical protein